MKVIRWSDYDTHFTDIDFLMWFEDEFGKIYSSSKSLDKIKKKLEKENLQVDQAYRSQDDWYFVFENETKPIMKGKN